MSQKYPKTSNRESLELVLILISICNTTDTEQLKKFISYCGNFIPDNYFNVIIRNTISYMRSKKCGNFSCEDWLMLNLYELYFNKPY